MQKTKRHILLILLASLIIPAHAQRKGFTQGYITNQEGETIRGWVKDRSSGTFIDLYTQIRFIPDHARGTRKYGPDEILGYGMNNQHFESMPLAEESSFFNFRYDLNEGNERVFLKVISRTNDLTYYHWEYVDGESNYLDYTPLFHRTGSGEMVRVIQGILGLKRNKLAAYFADCPELVQALEKKELNEIYDVFNFYTERCSGEMK
ncbi:MAG: hypothetical protein R6W31_15325 [Bacteroidales bacterium]